EGPHRDQQRVRARGARHGVLHLRVARQLLLEAGDLRAADEVAALHHATHGIVDLGADRVVLRAQVEQRDFQGRHVSGHRWDSFLRQAGGWGGWGQASTQPWFSSSCSVGTGRHGFAGWPTTMVRAGTSRVTVEPAATRPSSWMVTPGSVTLPAPMRPPFFTVTPLKCLNRSCVRPTKLSFDVTTPGATNTRSSSVE